MRTIKVKGVGKISIKPDLIVVSMNLETIDKEYDKAMELSAKKIEAINNTLEKIGFDKQSVKTTSFNVHTNYERVKDKNGEYKNVFNGYVCNHRLKVEFDFDTKLLAKVLNSISVCFAKPEFYISFTVKDKSSISNKLLQSVAQNAKEKAEILCSALNVKLGQLVSVNYNWGDIDSYSNTNYQVDGRCMVKAESCLGSINIEPEDIKVEDTANFEWEIL